MKSNKDNERQAIEEAAKGQAPTSDDAFFHYSDQDIWKEGFRFGAEFALSELRKQSEPEPVNQSELGDDLCKYCNREENKKGVYGVDGGYCAGCEGSDCDSAYENYLEKYYEPIGRTDEKLVQKIEDIMFSYSAPLPSSGLQIIFLDSVNKIATEIAKLLPSSRSQENDSNMELLETLKQLVESTNDEFAIRYGFSEERNHAIDIITNYEKQIKR